MPAQSTSADKKHQAQEARRLAALKSASNRRSRQTSSAVAAPVKSSPVESISASSNSGEELEGLFTSGVKESNSVSDSIFASISSDAATSESSGLDALCEIADSNPSVLGSDLSSVRQICRNRRKAMSSKGKVAVSGANASSKRGGNAARSMAHAAGQINSRDVAKLRRQEMANKGRGDEPASRPSGRVRPSIAPPKVETGTTLSGHEVSGTQVERTTSVTGNESGTCRSVTGTEYVGVEQFATFCGTKPEPNPPKVGMSVTGGGRPVSGTEVGRSDKVTGDEHGSCASVTGSEYVGAEKMAKFCGTASPANPAKVASGHTEKKDIRVTGFDEARRNATTGSEAGAKSQVTGSQYADIGAAKITINGPSKVALTHTIAGQSVTGTEVGRSAKVTGDEHGGCRPVTGMEYISNEQFASVCGTIPEPHPAKVGIDKSMHGQRITGALVDRTEKVTGNEPGSCSRLTGTQYGESKLCGGAAPKVNNMHTLSGNNLTGNSIDLSPKMTGDEQGGCLPVTGIEYYGQEQFAQCPSTPQPAPAKVGVNHTPKGEHVSGTMMDAVANVTGNEYGADRAVSGTPYAGAQAPHAHGSCCDACAIKDAAKAAGIVGESADVAHSHANVAQHAPMPAPQYVVQQAAPMAPPPVQQGFSIVSPARAAQITGNHDGGGRITGPGDLAMNRISGTPEFRYPDMRQMAAPIAPQAVYAPAPVEQAPQVVYAQPQQAPQVVYAPTEPVQQAVYAPAPVEQAQAPQAAMYAPAAPQSAEAIAMHAQRITGEGREDGFAVSGDNWSRTPGMTGTEGHVAQGRNPSLRVGEVQQPVNNAYHNKELERPEVPAAKVTGSSGNTHDGAVITVSGGARG